MDSLWELFEPVSALVSVLAGFTLILVLTRLKVPVAASIAAGAAVVVLLFDRSALQTASILGRGLIVPRTLAVAVVVALLLVLSMAMRASGRTDRMVVLMKSILRRPAISMAAMPAMIGLLPMPGGALFSAPMVSSAAAGTAVTGAQLSAINFWYRHLWEYWWPLYPGVIVGMRIAGDELGIDQGTFILWQLPMSLIMLLGGLWVFRGLHPDLHRSGERPRRGAKRQLLAAMSPVLLVIGIWIALKIAIWGTPRIAIWMAHKGVIEATVADWVANFAAGATWDMLGQYGTITLAVLVVLVWMAWRDKLGVRGAGGLLLSWSVGKLVLVVISAMVFMHALGVVEAGKHMGAEMKDLGMPVAVVVAALPFIAGMVLGVAVGFVGTAFPIVFPLVVGAKAPMAYVVLAYAFGHMGQMLSPIHICQIVTLEYFKSNYREVYPRIIPPAVLTAAGAAAYFLLVTWLA